MKNTNEDSCGRLIKTTDQAGYTSEIVYDQAGNVIKVILPEGVTESYTYNTNGSLLSVTDSLGNKTTYGYDRYGRTVSVTDPVGVTAKYRYDIAGNVVKNLFTGETYCYNAYDELISYTDAEGNVTKAVYNAQGNVVSETDALGNVTSYTYRKDGLLTSITDASGAVTSYEYNGKGLLSKEVNPLGEVTSYEYDLEYRPVKVTAPDGTVTEYVYNTDGNTTQVTATKPYGESETLRYLYGLDGSLTASVSSTDILEYAYEERGSVSSITKNGEHTVNLYYNGNGSLTLLEEIKAGSVKAERLTGYFYDAAGYLTEVRTGEDWNYQAAGYSVDGKVLLTRVLEDGEVLASYSTRADGLTESIIAGAGTVTSYTYNNRKQVTGVTITAEDGTILYREKNSYDKNGSLLSRTVSGEDYEAEELTYTFDALDRILSETKNGVTTE